MEKAIGLDVTEAVGLENARVISYPKDTLLKTYDCTVRLGGDIMHTVNKVNITTYAILLLRAIHGEGAVVDIKEVGSREVNELEHYYELALEYSRTMNPAHGLSVVEKVFGKKLVGFVTWYNNRMLAIDSKRVDVKQEKNSEAELYAANRREADAKTESEIAGKLTAKMSSKLKLAKPAKQIDPVEADEI